MTTTAYQQPKTKPTRPHSKRVPRPLFQLQDRDLDILEAIWQNRFLTRPLALLFFPPDPAKTPPHVRTDTPKRVGTNLERRLSELHHQGYAMRWRKELRGDLIYALTSKGAQLLNGRKQLELFSTTDWEEKNRDLSHAYIDHALMVARFHGSLTAATRVHPSVSIAHFERESKDLKADWKRDKKRIYVNPDAFLILQDTTRRNTTEYLNFFLEADQSTMQLSRIWEKCERYMQMFQDKVHRHAFDVADFRVLFVTKSAARASNIASIVAQDDSPIPPQYRSLFYFTTEEAYQAHPHNVLAGIWKRADDLQPMRSLVYSPLKRVS